MNAADILKYGHLTVYQAIDGLPDPAWQVGGVCGVWSVKDIVGHLAAYEHLLEEILASFVGSGGDTPYLGQMRDLGPAGFNDAQAAVRQGCSVRDVLAEYNDVYARVLALVPQVPPDAWRRVGALPWYGAEYDLEDFIVYNFYGHKREHCAQIAAYRDTLK